MLELQYCSQIGGKMTDSGKINIDDLMEYIRNYRYPVETGGAGTSFSGPNVDELPQDLLMSCNLTSAQRRSAVKAYTGGSDAEAFIKLLDELIRAHGNLTDSEIYKRANLNRDTFWRIRHNGDTKNRDWVLAIAFAIGLNELETLRLLEKCTRKKRELSIEEKNREALIMWFIKERDEGRFPSHDVADINLLLEGDLKDAIGKDIKFLGNAALL